jgi:SAM-dependent methyltransferase
MRRVYPLSAGDHLLDVGCGTGDFLRVARQQTGCKVSGIDQDATSINNALDRDKTTYHLGFFEEVDLEPEYTVITFFQSLEHHTDPVSALKRAHALLRPGGACVIEVPNFQGWWRYIFRTYWMPLCVPQHLTHFGKPILRKAVNAAGFQRIAFHRSMFYPIEGLASLFLLLWRGLHMPKRNQPDSWKWLWLILIVPLLLTWTIAVEIPTQALFFLFGRTGIQYLIAFRD